jgi:hypothetical protein
MNTYTTRSVTPTPSLPSIQISKASLSDLDTNLNDGELLVSKGYPAPPRKGKEIRICQSCKGVYLIVENTSLKIKCGYCTNNAVNQQVRQFEKLKIN